MTDELIMLDIYPARELPIEGVNSEMILDHVNISAKQLKNKQGAIEYIRNKRDENTLSGVSWTNGLSECVGKKCAVDVVNDTISQCSENCPNLQFDSANGFYGYDSNWGNSIFNRVVEIKSISEEELSVLVTIFWKNGVFTKEFSVRENLFNWQ